METSGIEEFAFLKGLVKLLRPAKILEIGTSIGLGTLNFASEMSPKTEIWTIDIEDKRCDKLKNFSGDVKIKFIKGRSQDILPQFVKEKIKFDLIFIDGDHHYNSVKIDWKYCSKLSDVIIFHDVLQYKGVYRVIKEIQRSNMWNVVILKYPPITLIDLENKINYQSNRVPGIAIVTKTIEFKDKSFLDFEIPSKYSKIKFKERKDFFVKCNNIGLFKDDMNLYDIEILFHVIWNYKPKAIYHIGHIGTSATILFMDYLLNNEAVLFLWDVSNNFWYRKKKNLPKELLPALKQVKIISEINIENNKKIFIWIDEWYTKSFYEKDLKNIITNIGPYTLIGIRGFSPTDNHPLKISIGKSQCINPRAQNFAKWLKDNLEILELKTEQASPEAVYGDYVNAGHWMYIWKKIS